MRPVDKGEHPLNPDGTPVVFGAYSDAAPYLKDRLGRFCSYCERKIPTGLAVEHVVPKSQKPELEKDWGNFLLACANCNSHKGSQAIELTDYLWPHVDDTFAAFTYEPSGAIKVAANQDQSRQAKAHALLALVGLDKSPNQASDADYRHRDRLEQWGRATAAFGLLALGSDQSLGAIRRAIIALATDGYSVWATVFRSDAFIQRELAIKYPGTKTDDAFSDPAPDLRGS